MHVANRTRVFVLIALLSATPSALLADESDHIVGATALVQGTTQHSQGDFEGAAASFKAAQMAFDHLDYWQGRIESRFRLAMSLQALGRFKMTTPLLREALVLAEKHEKSLLEADRASAGNWIAVVLNALGVAATLDREPNIAYSHFTQAAKRAAENPRLLTQVLNNLGNLMASLQKHDKALSYFTSAVKVAEDSKSNWSAAIAAANAASADVLLKDQPDRSARLARVMKHLELAGKTAHAAGDSNDRVVLLLKVADVWERMAMESEGDERTTHISAAFACAKAAEASALRLKHPRLQSLATGQLAGLYELAGQHEDAMALARTALFQAQGVRAPELIYRWQWQIGRLLAATGIEHRGQAIAAYRGAVSALESIESDVAIAAQSQSFHGSFREQVAPLYFELADLLLQAHDDRGGGGVELLIKSGKPVPILEEAKLRTESLKVAEFADFFQQSCARIIEQQTRTLEQLDPRAAVIYLIPLRDRTEILVTIGGKVERVISKVTADELNDLALRLRRQIRGQDLSNIHPTCKVLYDHLILPIKDKLNEVDTLVFVPDGALRTVPMGVLFDGKQYLVQRFAIAISPGLSLMAAPGRIRSDKSEVLLAGLSSGKTVYVDAAPGDESNLPIKKNFKPLNFVTDEVQGIKKIFPQATELTESEFDYKQLESSLSQKQYAVLHFATHAEFGNDEKQSFLLTYGGKKESTTEGEELGGKLTLSGLAALMRSTKFRDQPIELLTLSACETAAGNERAALGLAGIAVQSGARSALASLWRVDDQATAILMTEFYRALKGGPGVEPLSKAKALQAAQISALKNENTYEPRFWAPFLMIGDWR